MRKMILASFVFLAACGRECDDEKPQPQKAQSGFNLTLPLPVPDGSGSLPPIVIPVVTDHKREHDAIEWLKVQSHRHHLCKRANGRHHEHHYIACWPGLDGVRTCTASQFTNH